MNRVANIQERTDIYTMPNYNYECKKCQHAWEDLQTMANSDVPTKKPCPKCKGRKCVHKSWADCTPRLGADHTLTANSATGGRWNELMNRMKGATPKSTHHKFEHDAIKGRKWY